MIRIVPAGRIVTPVSLFLPSGRRLFVKPEQLQRRRFTVRLGYLQSTWHFAVDVQKNHWGAWINKTVPGTQFVLITLCLWRQNWSTNRRPRPRLVLSWENWTLGLFFPGSRELRELTTVSVLTASFALSLLLPHCPQRVSGSRRTPQSLTQVFHRLSSQIQL